LAAYQIGSQGRESLISIFRPAILDRDGLIFDLADLRQSLPEPSNIGCGFARRATAKKSDHRHRRLLRPRRERPSHRRAAEQRDEIAPPRVGHGASPSGVTTGNKAVSSACHNAAGKSSGQSRSTTRSAAASSRPATCCAVRP
jgi:hypothetical protein